MPAVSVLIVTYNSARFSQRLFDALRAQTLADFEVIVIDNASQDGGPVMPDDPRFRLIQSDVNLGFAAGNNRAAAEACGPWLATLNPDAFPDPNWLEAGLAAAAQHEGATMVGSLQIADENPSLLDGAGDCYHALGLAWRGLYGQPVSQAPPTGEVFGPCAAAAFYDAAAFRALGGFDEAFFCYHEDVDLALRMRLAGGRCVQSREARVRHIGSAIAGRDSEFSTFHGVRNRLWTFLQSMPPLLLWLLMGPHLAYTTYRCLAAPHAIRAATRRAVWAGLKDLPRVRKRRAEIQKLRRVSSAEIATALSWRLDRLKAQPHGVRPWTPALRTAISAPPDSARPDHGR